MKRVIRLERATPEERARIYRLRHDVYARELGQHPVNSQEALSDPLDACNDYIVAKIRGDIAGFVSITPPSGSGYSIDKYFSRQELPLPFDDGLYEIRILTVLPRWRRLPVASLLMYAAFRWVESRGGTHLVAIGRLEVLDLYVKVGMRSLGRQVESGAVRYELLSAPVAAVREGLSRYAALLRTLEQKAHWGLDIPFHPETLCYHGGAFFEAIGEDFEHLERSRDVIGADVLDAWFPPAPGVLHALEEHLPWLVRTSPPTNCSGMLRAIARVRGIPGECIVPGAGSSDLIFLAFRKWLTPASRVLILDPSYGEYAHVLEQLVRCRVDRLTLLRRDGYVLDPSRLEGHVAAGYDLIVLVNPNNPTGRHLRRRELEEVLAHVPARTRVWLDETYVEYAGGEESFERVAAASGNVIVCKSMSKVYALSGLRAAYLCAPAPLAQELRSITPPWAVSLPAQVAAVAALGDPDYYQRCYQETHELRKGLIAGIRRVAAVEIIPSVTNFFLCHLREDGPTAATVYEKCRAHGLFLRDAARGNPSLGAHTLRFAVKDAAANRRMIELFSTVLSGGG